MNSDVTVTLARAMVRYRAGQIDRRQLLRLLGGLGISAASLAAMPASSSAAPRRIAMALQEGTPEAPIQDVGAPATPELGEQPDGTVTWRVQVGGMSHEELIEAMAFLPDEITINAGDRIFFEFLGFHTVTFPGDQDAPPLIIPEAQALGTPAPTGDDASRWVLNPVAAFPSGEPVHDGANYVNSGIPDPTTPPFVVEFTEAGTFEYLCLVHPAMMKATVVVQEQGAERPHDQAYYDQQAAVQLEAILEQGRALIERYAGAGQATPAAGGGTTWDVAAGVGEDQTQVLRFLPDRLEIPAGDTVRWTNHAGTEPHTVTFLGDAEPPELVLVEPQPAGPPLLVFNPEIMEPAGGPSYDGTSFANSGWLQEEEAEFPEGVEFPETWELTFDTPGEYTYYCALHGGAGGEGDLELMGMVGTIIVS
jgi:plastocyanin